ncbi:Alpha/Beta hydrolase protein [Mucidula mucida]|nr:Alpha/Beta hydrolase protein [Mucidula mucida]
MSNEKRFQISVSDDKIDLLRRKLELCAFPDELEDAGSDYGVPLATMRRLVEYWKTGFDWRAQEAAINAELPHFTRDIKKSKSADAIPLLFVHGWPSSFLEVRKMLPLLTSGNPSFHVVALTPSKKGFRVNQYAEVAHKVMMALDYSEYVTHGGDLGTMITRAMALKYGTKHVKAWHTTLPYGFPPPPTRPVAFLQHLLTPYTAAEKAGAEKAQYGRYSLADSPVGLLAWLYEKLLDWTDEYPWTDDQGSRSSQGTWVFVLWFTTNGNLVFSNNTHTKGGHFGAWEPPEGMFGKGGPAFAVVSERSGY